MGLICLLGILSNHASLSICLSHSYCLRLLKDGGGGGWGLWFMLRPPSTQMVNTITQKALGGLFSNLVHTVIVIVPGIDQLFLVMCPRSRSHHHKNWLFCNLFNFYYWPHFVPKQVVRDIGIPSFTNTSFCPSVGSSHVQVLVHLQANPWWRHQMETFSALLAICVGHSPVNSPHKGQWRRALMFSLICAWINGWLNNREAGDLRRNRAHYDVIIMHWSVWAQIWWMNSLLESSGMDNSCST